jgi:hypothetical protein
MMHLSCCKRVQATMSVSTAYPRMDNKHARSACMPQGTLWHKTQRSAHREPMVSAKCAKSATLRRILLPSHLELVKRPRLLRRNPVISQWGCLNEPSWHISPPRFSSAVLTPSRSCMTVWHAHLSASFVAIHRLSKARRLSTCLQESHY